MRLALVFLFVGESAGDIGRFLRGINRGLRFDSEAARDDPCERGASEECFGGIDAFHVCLFCLFFVFLNAPAPEFTGECIQKVGVG